jgi:hypothetical protein
MVESTHTSHKVGPIGEAPKLRVINSFSKEKEVFVPRHQDKN